MNTTIQDLIDILAQNPIDLVAVKAWQIKFLAELLHLKTVRFKEGKFYGSGLTKEERWGSIWCCNLINEILERDEKRK